MNNFVSLNETGIISSPEGILEAIIQRFRVTDQYQSKLFPVASLPGIIATTQGKPDLLKSTIDTALSRVLEAYFDDTFELEVDLVDLDDGSTDIVIRAAVTGKDGIVEAAWAMRVIEDTTGLPRRINNEEINYEV